MMDRTTASMTAPLDDIDWVTWSENRVQALELLAEQSRSRSELLEEIDVSQVTFNRQLEAPEERS